MSIEVRVYANADEASIVWRASAPIPGCRGFALLREAIAPDGKVHHNELETYVGFADQPPAAPGTRRRSSVWPIQRFLWHDYGVEAFDRVRYRVVPMLGSASDLVPADDDACSAWSDWCPIGSGPDAGLDAFFNRGIVAAQWLTRRLAVPVAEQHAKLATIIADPTSTIRRFLAGQDREALLRLLANAKANGDVLYLALYELNDPELIAALSDLGPNANLILASGAFGPGKPDENADVRAQLKAAVGGVHVDDRLVKGNHFAHNKFAVVCDPDGTPRQVWTGSTNWTMTGLCTQANNALLITDPTVASGYLAYWNRLRAAGSGYPPELKTGDATPITATVGTARLTAWTVPVDDELDLADARRHIQAATQGVLFLFFNPGPAGTLLNDILALNDRSLFVHGVINQDPGGADHPLVRIVQRGHVLDANPDVILPAAISTPLASWLPELRQYSTAMIHSKVVVVDPFGANPVVITGSHNLGPKASGQNDDNLVIVEGAPGLAAAYAVNILGIYDQYKWRYNMLVASKAASPTPAATPAAPVPAPASVVTAPADPTTTDPAPVTPVVTDEAPSAPSPAAVATVPASTSTTDAAPAAAAVAPTPVASPDAATPADAAAAAPAANHHQWTGLADDDRWQDEFFGLEKMRELRFWFGESPAVADPPA